MAGAGILLEEIENNGHVKKFRKRERGRDPSDIGRCGPSGNPLQGRSEELSPISGRQDRVVSRRISARNDAIRRSKFNREQDTAMNIKNCRNLTAQDRFRGDEPAKALSFSALPTINDAGRIDIGTGAVLILDLIGLPSMLVHINACSYMQAGGETSVSAHPDAKGVMRLSVTVGAGISPEQIVGSLARLMSRGLMLIPSLHTQMAARKLERLAAGITNAILSTRTFIGGGLPMTIEHATNTGAARLVHRGNKMTRKNFREHQRPPASHRRLFPLRALSRNRADRWPCGARNRGADPARGRCGDHDVFLHAQ
ncbi:hypothetical protein [Saliniramus sp.]|uniref:hypothetical protein n=1 Tax=Saliniramus sp. TaxID=2986772 RepID=UPI002C4EF7BD|nr:hypothetical protein [Saliniramus sp.]HMB10522.1 hypothetical protein [Saliniramus sp.]